ncbi:MAG: DNA adenine methylase [Bacteroidia bacterium]|nr:DNA adenine methylase [Bacteroidia bacterium]MDW8332726.1 DNA adenine methylase [Bacteroidia bacterium]
MKWAGGKGRLLPALSRLFPSGPIKRYVEPFVGAGAVFFHVASVFKPQTVVLSDANADLISVYRIIQRRCDELIRHLRRMQRFYDAVPAPQRNDLFLSVREAFNQRRGEAVERAAQLIFLNKTCFNGLFRLNAAGEFNVPFGGYAKPLIADEVNLRAVAAVLENTELLCGDFEIARNYIDDQTFVYLDPPYHPIGKTSSFTAYTGSVFTENDQFRLSKFFREMDLERGAKLMLSNSHHPIFDRLYAGYSIHKILAPRAINSKADGRGKIFEIVVTNYSDHESRTLELNF